MGLLQRFLGRDLLPALLMVRLPGTGLAALEGPQGPLLLAASRPEAEAGLFRAPIRDWMICRSLQTQRHDNNHDETVWGLHGGWQSCLATATQIDHTILLAYCCHTEGHAFWVACFSLLHLSNSATA